VLRLLANQASGNDDDYDVRANGEVIGRIFQGEPRRVRRTGAPAQGVCCVRWRAIFVAPKTRASTSKARGSDRELPRSKPHYVQRELRGASFVCPVSYIVCPKKHPGT
jgi:hypothetical protein